MIKTRNYPKDMDFIRYEAGYWWCDRSLPIPLDGMDRVVLRIVGITNEQKEIRSWYNGY